MSGGLMLALLRLEPSHGLADVLYGLIELSDLLLHKYCYGNALGIPIVRV